MRVVLLVFEIDGERWNIIICYEAYSLDAKIASSAKFWLFIM